MNKFIQSLEIMRARGYICAGYDENRNPEFNYLRPNEQEWNLFEKCQPFVFSNDESPVDLTHNAQVIAKSWMQYGADAQPELDAPFPVFSIETLWGNPLDFYMMVNQQRRFTMQITVVELAPKEYGYYALCKDEGDPREEFKVFKSNTDGETVKRFLSKINTQQMGLESVKRKIKIGTGAVKRFHIIRKIIHVAPKSMIKHPQTYIGNTRQVDWTHRWTVRGHWRKHDGLGKDRDGNYCISGYTWVVNHEKGPAELPLINKTRLVK